MNNDTIRDNCTGPNAHCRKAARNGQTVHIIPNGDEAGSLVLPTYHYSTREEATKALEIARRAAIVIETDEQLYDARKRGIAHFIPKGWIDPSYR